MNLAKDRRTEKMERYQLYIQRLNYLAHQRQEGRGRMEKGERKWWS